MTALLRIKNATSEFEIPSTTYIPGVGEVTFAPQSSVPGGRGLFPGVETISFVLGIVGGSISSIALSVIANYIYDKITDKKGKMQKLTDTEYVIVLADGATIEIFISD